jgi:hypothetical protein
MSLHCIRCIFLEVASFASYTMQYQVPVRPGPDSSSACNPRVLTGIRGLSNTRTEVPGEDRFGEGALGPSDSALGPFARTL